MGAESLYRVFITQGAERDLKSIHDYVAEFDGPQHAVHVLSMLLECIGELSHSPERGNFPKELLSLGIREYRQLFFKPYRIIYRQRERDIHVYLVVDGRRDLQHLLSRRLLG
jgi:toxin ParE1/3/4